jgi:hypothetical protein
MKLSANAKFWSSIGAIMVILIILLFLLKKGIDSQLDKEAKESYQAIEAASAESYERGLWDGFNLTVKYLNDKKYLKDNDTIKIEITELIDVLHSKNNQNAKN